jgi:hypothetical protein
MPFPRNQAYVERQPNRLKPGWRYCGNCEQPVTGLLTLDANNRLVGECCAPTVFKTMYKKKVDDAP